MDIPLEVLIGTITVAVGCSTASFFIWQKHTENKHRGKMLIFTSFSFLIGGAFGLIGGVPMLLISYFYARSLRPKEVTRSTEGRKEAV